MPLLSSPAASHFIDSIALDHKGKIIPVLKSLTLMVYGGCGDDTKTRNTVSLFSLR
jgi:hypothetical protein